MMTVGKSLLAAGIALSFTMSGMSGASAQMMGGGHRRQADAARSATAKPKVDEKAYVETTGSLPDKSYDPWRTLR